MISLPFESGRPGWYSSCQMAVAHGRDRRAARPMSSHPVDCSADHSRDYARRCRRLHVGFELQFSNSVVGRDITFTTASKHQQHQSGRQINQRRPQQPPGRRLRRGDRQNRRDTGEVRQAQHRRRARNRHRPGRCSTPAARLTGTSASAATTACGPPRSRVGSTTVQHLAGRPRRTAGDKSRRWP